MNTCKTCQHFKRKDAAQRSGECELLFFLESCYDEVPNEELDKMLHFNGGDYDHFKVGENFGCIHHAEK